MIYESLAIITPIRDTPKKYLFDCINSIAALSEHLSIVVEWILVIDGDERPIEDWVYAATSKMNLNYKILRTTEHIGLGAARNMAVESTNASYLTWLDADDLYNTQEAVLFFERGFPLLQCQNDICLIYSDNSETDCNLSLKHIRNKSFFNNLHNKYRGSHIDPIFYVDFIYQAQIIRRDVFLQIGGFTADGIGEDVELVLKLATQYPDKIFYHLPYIAYIYRQNLNGIVNTRYTELRSINSKDYFEYSTKVGVYEAGEVTFEVLYLNTSKNILSRDNINDVFFNTFLPNDIDNLFYISK